MGGNVYRCDWKKTRNGYSLWLANDPNVSVTKPSVDECQDALGDLIQQRFGDSEAVIDFVGRPPGLPRRYGSPEFRLIGWDATATLKTAVEDLYAGGLCPVCGSCFGQRTETAIQVVKLPDDAVGVSVGRISAAVYAEKFLRELGVLDSKRYTFRRVVSLPKFESAGIYYEIIPKSNDARVFPVAVKDLEEHIQAWKCSRCGSYDISYLLETSFVHFVPASIVSGLAEPTFLLGSMLCVAGKAWRDLKCASGKAISTEQVGIVSADDMDQEPRFEVRHLSPRPVPFWVKPA